MTHYRAFLSYSHADTRIARKVHARLEGFRIDKDLVGRPSAQGPVPAALRPIFRDRNDFSAGHSLDDQTLAALDASAALIVLASPHAATSRYVDEEVRLFKTRHPDRPIIPLIVAGAMDAGEADYFPPALRFAVADGLVSETPAHVLAADLREPCDGFLLAIAKVVARLIGVSPDLVFRRAERERRRQARLRGAIAAVVATLAILGGALFWQTREQKRTLTEIDALVRRYSVVNPALGGRTDSLTEAFRSIAEGAATDPRYAKALDLLKQGQAAAAEPLLKAVAEDKARRAEKDAKDAAAAYRNLAVIAAVSDPARARGFFARAVQLDPTNIEGLLQSAFVQTAAGDLTAAETVFGAVIDKAKPTDPADVVFWARVGLSGVRRARGRLEAALEGYREAERLAQQHAAKAPADVTWQFALAVVRSARADSLVVQGKLADALAAYRSSQAILETVAKTDTTLPADQVLAASLSKTGTLLSTQGDLGGALKAYEAARAILTRLTRAQPQSIGLQRELMVSDSNVGDVLFAQGKVDDAAAAFETARRTADRLAGVDAGNAGWQLDRSMILAKIGDVWATRGNPAEALKTFEAARAVIAALVERDPGNSDRQHALAMAMRKVGDIRTSQGDLNGALDVYRTAAAILERLAGADPGDTSLRHDLGILQTSIGSVLQAQGRLPDAIASYRQSVAVAEILAANDRGNAIWRRELEISYNKIGDALMAGGDLAGALQAFQNAGRIAEALAAAGPNNADWQRDLSIAKKNLGAVLAVQGKPMEALTAFRAALAIDETLAKAAPGNAVWQNDLASAYIKVGNMQAASNDPAGAEASFRAGLAIAERAASAAPGTTDAQRELAVAHVKIGGVEEAQRKLDAALASFETARAIIAKLKSSPALRHDHAGILGRIGAVQLARNDTAAALTAFSQELALSEQLAGPAPDNTAWQYQLALAYGHLAIVYDRMTRDAEARDALGKGREVLVRLTRSHPGWADWKTDLDWFDQRLAAKK